MNRLQIAVPAFAALFFANPAAAEWKTHGSRSETPDEGIFEVYASSIEDYGGGDSDLAVCHEGAQALLGHLQGAGYSWAHSLDSTACAADYRQNQMDNAYNDAADFSYYAGHGWSGNLTFHNGRDDNASVWDTHYGDNDLEVLVMDSCYPIDFWGRWAFIWQNRNAGVHHLQGFETTALDTTITADTYGCYLAAGYDVDVAWMRATQAGHPSTHKASHVRFYNSGCDTYWDELKSWSRDPIHSSSTVETVWTL